MDLFQCINRIYTSPDLRWVEEVNESISPVVVNLMLSRYYKVSHVVSKLNKYVYHLDSKQFCALAWAMIQPKLSKSPFVKKVEEKDVSTRYDFLLDKIRKRLEISNNDWVFCKDFYLQDVKEKTVEYLAFYGCPKKEWNILGLDIEESKKINVTDIKEGLDRWM